jgi:hypothetical protein
MYRRAHHEATASDQSSTRRETAQTLPRVAFDHRSDHHGQELRAGTAPLRVAPSLAASSGIAEVSAGLVELMLLRRRGSQVGRRSRCCSTWKEECSPEAESRGGHLGLAPQSW